jgi:uncharacterized protein (DUF305 family)
MRHRAAKSSAVVTAVLVAAGVLALAPFPARAGAAQSTAFDRVFIDAMVPHHRMAINMAKEAKRAGLSSPELVAIATAVIRTQAAEIERMLSWREAWYGSRRLTPDAGKALGLTKAQMGMDMRPGQIANAADVDAAFAAMMIPHHAGAVAMARLALTRAKHAQLASLARQIIAAQQREIVTLRPHASQDHTHG